MGTYLNPPNEDKLQWLMKNAKITELGEQKFVDPTTNEVAVCLVDNGAFMAAAVADFQQEFDVFNREQDLRPKMWFVVSLDKIAEIDPTIVSRIRGSALTSEKSDLVTSDNNSENLEV